MGVFRGRQLLVLLNLAPWNCLAQSCNEPNGRDQVRPSVRESMGRGHEPGGWKETAGGILRLTTEAEKHG